MNSVRSKIVDKQGNQMNQGMPTPQAAQITAQGRAPLTPKDILTQSLIAQNQRKDQIEQQIKQEMEQQKGQQSNTMNQMVLLKIQNAKEGYVIEDLISQAKTETIALTKAVKEFKDEVEVSPHPLLTEQLKEVENDIVESEEELKALTDSAEFKEEISVEGELPKQ